MVGPRAGYLFVVLALSGCGSSEHSPTGEGGSGGTLQDASGGVVATGGATNAGSHAAGALSGGSPNGGSKNGGAASGGAPSAGAQNGGGASASGGKGGASAGGAAHGGNAGAAGSLNPPKCELKDDDSAPFVEFERTAEPAPEATGGPISSGTYFLTKLTYHGGMHVEGTTCLPSLMREVLRFNATSDTAGTMHSTIRFMYADGSGDSTTSTQLTYEAQGPSLTGEYTCSVTGNYRSSYVTNGNQLLTMTGPFDPPCDKGVVLVFTYEKQP